VTPTTSPQDERTSELLSRLRTTTLPGSLGASDVEAYVTGGTALTDDVARQLQQRMPLFLGAVIGLSFLVLTVVFRSILVPLKAAVLNLLGVGASYGVVSRSSSGAGVHTSSASTTPSRSCRWRPC
jgi:RND superfamily putative drug exporter